MAHEFLSRVESTGPQAFAALARAEPLLAGSRAAAKESAAGRMNLDPDKIQNGLCRLVLTLVKLLHELLERQAIRRIDAGALSEAEMERLGLALLKQAEEIERLRMAFALDEEDLNLDLGPLGRLL